MQYAKTIKDGQNQLLSFRLKKHRDEYVWHEGCKPVTKEEAAQLSLIGEPQQVQGVREPFTMQAFA